MASSDLQEELYEVVLSWQVTKRIPPNIEFISSKDILITEFPYKSTHNIFKSFAYWVLYQGLY